MNISEAFIHSGATIIGEYPAITLKTRIRFRCKCGQEYEKTAAIICKGTGAFCKWCTSKNTAIGRLKSKIAEQKRLLALENVP